MRQKSGTGKAPAEQVIKDIRRATRKQYGAEEKIRIVLEGLRGEESIAALQARAANPGVNINRTGALKNVAMHRRPYKTHMCVRCSLVSLLA